MSATQRFTGGVTNACPLPPPPPTDAEEAVNEVKRQAMDEVQKAVAEAEQKAFEMIAAERAKMEKTLAEAKRKAQEDAILIINEQEDSSEVSGATRWGGGVTKTSAAEQVEPTSAAFRMTRILQK